MEKNKRHKGEIFVEKNKKCKCEKAVNRDWRELHPDVIGLIASKLLSFFDLLSFKGVCSSWRFAENRINKKPFSMLLFIESITKKTQQGHENSKEDVPYDILFMNINQKKPYELMKAQCSVQHNTRHHIMIGSNPQGWLIMLDRNKHPYLIKLFPMIRIQLPELIIDLSFYFKHDYTVKGILSCNSDQSHLVVIIMYGPSCKRKLCIWKTGDRNWARLEGDNYIDISFCDNKPYALTTDYRSVYVELLDFGNGYHLAAKRLSIIVSNERSRRMQDAHRLVWSSAGEILVVNCRRSRCIIWRVNLGERRCEKVNALNGNSLIVGDVTSMCVLGNEVEDEGYKPNSVYVVHTRYSYEYPRDMRLSVYDLEAGRDKQLWRLKRGSNRYRSGNEKNYTKAHLFGLIRVVC